MEPLTAPDRMAAQEVAGHLLVVGVVAALAAQATLHLPLHLKVMLVVQEFTVPPAAPLRGLVAAERMRLVEMLLADKEVLVVAVLHHLFLAVP
jgi:hypothetical protein